MQNELAGEQGKENLLKARLSEMEKSQLVAFAANPEMVHAVEKALLYSIYEMGTVKSDDKNLLDIDTNWAYSLVANPNLSNEQVGQELKARVAGLSYLDDAFKQIKKFTAPMSEPKEEVNPAL